MVWQDLFKFGSKKNDSQQNESNVYSQPYVKEYESKQECLVLDTSTGSTKSIYPNLEDRANEQINQMGQQKSLTDNSLLVIIKEKNQKLNEELERLKNEQETFHDKFKDQQQKLEEKENEINTNLQTINFLSEDVKEHEQKLEAKDKEISNLRKTVEDLKKKVNIQDIEGQKQKLEAKDEISNLHKTIEDLKNKVNFPDIDEQKQKLEAKLEAKDKEISNLSKTVEDLKNKVNLLNGEEKGQKLEAKDKEITDLNKTIEDLKNKVNSLEIEEQDQKQKLEEKDKEIINLLKTIEDLKNEASKHQSALGKATNFRLNDDDRNNSVQLRDDITSLQKSLKDFCIVKPGIEINKTEANNLLQQYGCTEFTDDESFKSLLKAALQRFVLETITQEYSQLSENEDENTKDKLLETRIVSGTTNLLNMMKEFANFREGDDEVTRAFPTKLRQQIYAVLGNRGFSKVLSENINIEHPFIDEIQQRLIEKMNNFRTVNDPNKVTKLNSMAANIIRDVIRIFFFRLKVQEPEVDPPRWFKYKDQVNSILMEGTFDRDCQGVVQICSFPLIGIDLDDENKQKILVPATVHVAES